MTDDLTPMLKQYFAVKDECGDAIVFFRLGDFFEMFGDDAKTASQILNITLTGRDAGRNGRLPMCGIPHHAAEGYVAKLLDAGYKVAICDQVEDPRFAKGIVKREVVRIVTPGTIMDRGALADKENNFIASLFLKSGRWGLSYADASTGEFWSTEVAGEGAAARVCAELIRLNPAELLMPDTALEEPRSRRVAGEYLALEEYLRNAPRVTVSTAREVDFGLDAATRVLTRHFGTISLDGFGCATLPGAAGAAGALMAYLQGTQKTSLSHIQRLSTYSLDSFMTLDPSSRRSLELTQSQKDGSRRHTLLSVLDRTVTAMGGRLLRNWIERPLLSVAPIVKRLDAVGELVEDLLLREEVKEYLRAVNDLERLTGRIGSGSANARDLVAMRDSLEAIPHLKAALAAVTSGYLVELREALDELTDIRGLIAEAIEDNPPATLKEGNLIRCGYHAELDELREASRNGKGWIAGLEAREREATGIKSLKVGFNKVFGYYLEVTRTNLDAVPASYLRKQTLANGERFITPELKEFEAMVLGAEDKMIELEYELFGAVREQVASASERIQGSARSLAQLDVLLALAQVAVANNYRRPAVSDSDAVRIMNGRHPVVEATLPTGEFVANDCLLDGDTSRFMMVTGPNMAGKSTYLRQIALICLMAQMGSFVPADEAEIGLVDRVFTRVGASDDLATGQSTFMVEMNEVANILHHATRRSLIILDEVGRGTSTFDGLAIAWAVTEFIHDKGCVGAKTLFATHYHELTNLAGRLDGVKNLSVAVRKQGETISFLRKIIPGGADESYGIEVARLAGLPRAVLARAREVLAELRTVESELGAAVGERANATAEPGHPVGQARIDQPSGQLGLFADGATAILHELASLDPVTLTPLDALTTLFRLSAAAREEVSKPVDGKSECGGRG